MVCKTHIVVVLLCYILRYNKTGYVFFEEKNK